MFLAPVLLIKKSGKSIALRRGHGHLVGLCQRGAYQLVLKGWKITKVSLSIIIPKTYFMKLQKIQIDMSNYRGHLFGGVVAYAARPFSLVIKQDCCSETCSVVCGYYGGFAVS